MSSKLFDLGDVKNHPRRSAFDLEQKIAFTAKAGELLPVYWCLTYPGDRFKLGINHLTRTAPVQTAAFTRIREYFDWYYVPLRLLNKNIGQALVQMQDNAVQASSISENKAITLDIPYAPLSFIGNAVWATVQSHTGADPGPTSDGLTLYNTDVNLFGFSLASCSMKLLQYLGYGNVFDSGVSESLVKTSGITTKNIESGMFDYAEDVNVNILPLLAYQKIYADYFRYSQWEKNEAYTYNTDYYTGGNILSSLDFTTFSYRRYLLENNIFTLRYANWKKDMFMGMFPNSQFGNVSVVNLGSETTYAPVVGGAFNATDFVRAFDEIKLGRNGSSVSSGDEVEFIATAGKEIATLTGTEIFSMKGVTAREVGNISGDQNILHAAIPALATSFNILQFRMAEAVQKWKEVSICSDQNYRDQIYAHFKVRLSKALSDECQYLGGSASNIDISEVVNQSLNPDPQGLGGDANIKGKGVGSSQSYSDFYCEEHGILMCIYHAVPLLDYVLSGPALELLYTSTTDLPQPEFDALGLQTIPYLALSNDKRVYSDNTSISPLSAMGYVPRYIDLKTRVDKVMGAFTTTLQDWVAPIDPFYLASWFKNAIGSNPDPGERSQSVNANFFKVNPRVLDNLFGVECDSTWDTDQFRVNAFFDVQAVRNFDYDGMPY